MTPSDQSAARLSESSGSGAVFAGRSMPTNKERPPVIPTATCSGKTPAAGCRPGEWKNGFHLRNWQSRTPDQALLPVVFPRLTSARFLHSEPDFFVPTRSAILGCADGFEPVLPLLREESACCQRRRHPRRRQAAFAQAHRRL